MKKKQLLKWINKIITSLLFIVLMSVAFMVLVTKFSGGEPQIFGYQFKTVLSGSMEPEIKTGSIIAVKLGGDMTRFEENEVITFREESQKVITHRITEVVHSGEHTMYRTKGDSNANPDADLVLSDNVIASYTGFTIPYAGYIANFAQSQNGALLLLIPGILLLIYSAFTIWTALSKMEVSPKKKLEEPDEGEERLSS